MIRFLVLVKIVDRELFTKYLKGHLPTMEQYGGKVVFRSTGNSLVQGAEGWDVVVIQEWPSESAFDRWWNSKEYAPWSEIRDNAARMTIVKLSEAEGDIRIDPAAAAATGTAPAKSVPADRK